MLKRITSDKIPAAVGSYSPASLIDGLIFTSGQLPINPLSGKIDEDCIEWQVNMSLTNVKAILEDNGSSMDNIVKTTVYLANIADFAAFNKVYASFFKEGNYPARTAFAVGALPLGAKVEIEVIAKA